MKRNVTLLAVLALFGTGCYHATVETGATPSTQTIEKPWASGWIYGLVPPSTVETAQRCPNGVAKIETQLSFPNQLVNFLTFGIYTPMAIRVTCAQGGRSEDLTTISAGADASAAVNHAANLARTTLAPVAVKF